MFSATNVINYFNNTGEAETSHAQAESLEPVKSAFVAIAVFSIGLSMGREYLRTKECFFSAVRTGQHWKVRLCLAAGVNVNLQDRQGKTALMLAVNNTNKTYFKIIQTLINARANLDLQTRQGETALIRAARGEHTSTVQSLVNAKANLDLQTSTGQTALISAALDGDTEIVQTLINARANPALKTRKGNTALNLAIKGGAYQTSPSS